MTEGNTASHAKLGNQQEASDVPQIDSSPNAAPASPNFEAQRSTTSPQSPFMIVAPRMASTERTALLAAAEEDHPPTGSRRSVAFASPSPLGSRQQRAKPERPRPRFWFLLPLLALIDLALEAFIGSVILKESPEDPPSDGRHGSTGLDETKKTSLIWTLLTLAFLRTSIMGIVGIGNKSDQLGLMVATMAALSILILLAVFNLLFQSGDLFSHANHSDNSILARLPIRPLALMTAISGVATILEYLLYIAVVGIRVPPTQMREARRWKRGVRASQPGVGEEEWLIEEEEEPQQRTASGSFRGRSARRSPSSSGATEGFDAVVAAMPRYGATDQTDQSVAATHFEEGGRLEAQHVSNQGDNEEHQQEQAPKGSPQIEQLIGLAPSAMEEGAAAEDLSEDIGEEEGQDPNEIVDIGVPSSFSRDASRARLELSVADEAERARRRRDSRTSSAHLLTSPEHEEAPVLAQEEAEAEADTTAVSLTPPPSQMTSFTPSTPANKRLSITTATPSSMTKNHIAEMMSNEIIKDIRSDKTFYTFDGNLQKTKTLSVKDGQLSLSVIAFKTNKTKIVCHYLPSLKTLNEDHAKGGEMGNEVLNGLYDMEKNRWIVEGNDQTPSKPLATLKAKGQGLLRSISGSAKNSSSGGGEDDGSVSSKGKRRRLFSNNLGRKD